MLLKKVDVKYTMNLSEKKSILFRNFIRKNYDLVQFNCSFNGIVSKLVGTKSSGGDVTITLEEHDWSRNKLVIYDGDSVKTYEWDNVNDLGEIYNNITKENNLESRGV